MENLVPHNCGANASSYQEPSYHIRKLAEKRRMCSSSVLVKPPPGFEFYLMNTRNYLLAHKPSSHPSLPAPPHWLPSELKDLFVEQESQRQKMKTQHRVEKEKLILSMEQEVVRTHIRSARELANKSLPFSMCVILKDEEVFNATDGDDEISPSQRSRYNHRVFLRWLQDIYDKWAKTKHFMIKRHHHEVTALQATQNMEWGWKMDELGMQRSELPTDFEKILIPRVKVTDFELMHV